MDGFGKTPPTTAELRKEYYALRVKTMPRENNTWKQHGKMPHGNIHVKTTHGNNTGKQRMETTTTTHENNT